MNHANAAEEEIIVYFGVSGVHTDSAAELRNVFVRSIDELAKFKAVKTAKGYLGGNRTLGERLSAAEKADVPWVADVSLETEKKSGVLTLKIYRASGENVFTLKEKYSISSIRGFIAEMEYKTPMQLKQRFLELGHVIKTDSRFVYFDLGDTADVKAGEFYQIYHEGDEIEDNEGNSFGYLDVITGVIRVISVNPNYAVGEMVNGQFTIESGDYVRKIRLAKGDSYRGGEILSVMEGQVAINIGKDVGVEEGSYYAVYRDIKAINNNEAFRHPVGHIKITEVYDDFSKGVLSISDTYDITKYTIQKGDAIRETESPRKNMWSANQLITNIAGSKQTTLTSLAYQRDSASNVDLVYRMRGGYTTGTTLFAAGVMHSLKHSAHVFAGLDVLYVASASAVNFFISADVDTPLSQNLKINMETGYILAHPTATYNGINMSLGLKYGFGLF